MRLSFVRSLPLLALGVACSMQPAASDGDGESGRGVERVSSAIINGSVDTAHPAVVALILAKGAQGGLCSGTIVKKDVARKIGWVATAAHCVEIPPSIVVQAQDFSAPTAIRYNVIDYKADTQYNPNNGSHDFAMVRIAGIDESTPVIPLTTAPDGVGNGTPVTSVGFGRIALTEPTKPEDQNTQRRVVQKTLDDVNTQLIGFDMQTRGICQGDSGGPILAGTGASERIVGIHSFVQGGCDGRGYGARVTAGLTFYNGELAKALPADSCSLCEKVANSGKSVCASESASCLADPECKGYYECLSGGKKAEECFKEYPLAEGPFYAAANCVCGDACKAICSSSNSCRGVPKCGYKMTAGTCATCVEGSCCQEEKDCAADGQCYVCLKNNDTDPKCATNATRKKLATCAASKCATECAGTSIQTGAEPVPGEEEPAAAAPVAGPTTTTTTGCSASPAAASSSNFSALTFGFGALALVYARRRRSRAAARGASR